MPEPAPSFWIAQREPQPDGGTRITFQFSDGTTKVVTFRPSIELERNIQESGEALAALDRRYRDPRRARSGG